MTPDIIPCGAAFEDPCQNGATCNRVGQTSNHTCTCANGYEGDSCESKYI